MKFTEIQLQHEYAGKKSGAIVEISTNGRHKKRLAKVIGFYCNTDKNGEVYVMYGFVRRSNVKVISGKSTFEAQSFKAIFN